jgi:hypothetical protein
VVFDIICCVKGVGDGYQAEGQLYHAMLAARIGIFESNLILSPLFFLKISAVFNSIFYCVKGVGDGYQAEGQLYHAMLAARIGMLSQELQAVRSDMDSREHRLNMELDLQCLPGLLCTAVLIG